MSIDQDSVEKRRNYADFRDDLGSKNRRSSNEMVQPKLVHGQIETEKRVRRQIANSNERRRMQSINAGFDALRILLPPMTDGEKVSKATILQLTAKYISSLVTRVNILENEVTVYRQNANINTINIGNESDNTDSNSGARKRKSDESKKNDQLRVRRRKMENNNGRLDSVDKIVDVQPVLVDPNQHAYAHTTSLAVSTVHLTPSVSSISYASESPRPESATCTAARLEHLVMAIEQIEGGRAFNVSPGQESPGDDSLSVDRSPSLPCESMYYQGQENYQHFPYGGSHSSSLKQTSEVYSDVFSTVGSSNITTDMTDICKRKGSSEIYAPEDYPIVTKLLNRTIPHKYLHRPQVVVNSTH